MPPIFKVAKNGFKMACSFCVYFLKMWYNIFKYKKRIGINMASVIDIVFGVVMFVIGFFVGVSRNENS